MLKTPWTDLVDRNNPWPEYPRPQLARKAWINLNGPWEYVVVEKEARWVTDWQGPSSYRFPSNRISAECSGVWARPNACGTGAPSRPRIFPAADACSCTSAPSTGRPRCG